MTERAMTERATRGSVAAIVLAALAAIGPVGMILLFLVYGPDAPAPADVGAGVFAVVMGFVIEVALGPVFAGIALVLALVNRRRGAISRRNSGIALTILGVGVALLVLQVLLYWPFD
jgi:hypothetical protein